MGPHNTGRCRQEVVIRGWSLTQVWLYFESAVFLVMPISIRNSSHYNFWHLTKLKTYLFFSAMTHQGTFVYLRVNFGKVNHFCRWHIAKQLFHYLQAVFIRTHSNKLLLDTCLEHFSVPLDWLVTYFVFHCHCFCILSCFKWLTELKICLLNHFLNKVLYTLKIK